MPVSKKKYKDLVGTANALEQRNANLYEKNGELADKNARLEAKNRNAGGLIAELSKAVTGLITAASGVDPGAKVAERRTAKDELSAAVDAASRALQKIS